MKPLSISQWYSSNGIFLIRSNPVGWYASQTSPKGVKRQKFLLSEESFTSDSLAEPLKKHRRFQESASTLTIVLLKTRVPCTADCLQLAQRWESLFVNPQVWSSLSELAGENRTDSLLKAGLHLGWTVDFELHAHYLWKRHTNWKTRPPERRAPRLLPRLSIA